jgi:hypothetical protein
MVRQTSMSGKAKGWYCLAHSNTPPYSGVGEVADVGRHTCILLLALLYCSHLLCLAVLSRCVVALLYGAVGS